MPFKSDKQRAFLFAKKPDVAKKFAQDMGAPKGRKEKLDLKGVIEEPKTLSAWAKIPQKGGK